MTQLSFFDMLSASSGVTAGLAGVMPEIRARMNAVAAEYPKGRKMLVGAIIEVAQREGVALTSGGGKSITDEQLDKALQPKAGGHEPTLGFIHCFCLATRNFTPLEPIWKPFGLVLIPADDLRYLEYGKSCVMLEEAREHHKKAKGKL